MRKKRCLLSGAAARTGSFNKKNKRTIKIKYYRGCWKDNIQTITMRSKLVIQKIRIVK